MKRFEMQYEMAYTKKLEVQIFFQQGDFDSNITGTVDLVAEEYVVLKCNDRFYLIEKVNIDSVDVLNKD